MPASLMGCSVDEFMTRLAGLDAPMLARLKAARRPRTGSCATWLRSTRPQAGPRWASWNSNAPHAFANMNLTDNVVRFITSRYDKNPLVVQGPGARAGSHGRRRVRATCCACVRASARRSRPRRSFGA